MNAPTRPAIRWYGGKWRLAPWIIAHLPPHKVYVEPFGGGASVLLRKPRAAKAEIYNDLDEEVVNLFRVLRDTAQAEGLTRLLRLTPFARREFEASYERCDDPVERARRLLALAFMGFGSNSHSRRSTGFRANSTRSGTTPADDWAHFPDAVGALVERLQGVTVECRDALEVMAQHDSADTVHYVDPPYVHSTRGRGNKHDTAYRFYAVELKDSDHARLLTFLKGLTGGVVLSGYPHPLYDGALGDWRRIEREAFADGARRRTEVLWLNRHAASRLSQPTLFATGEAA